MHIDKDSYGTIATVLSIVAALIVILFVFCHNPWVEWPLAVFALVFSTWQVLFFRVPVRSRNGSDSLVSSVADGKVVIIEKVFEEEWLKRECIQVSIYMDFWNVHANFWPVDGTVTYYKYHPGKHLLAFTPKASSDNEHSCVGMRSANGQELLFKQLAGTFARRIVCYAEPGLGTRAGEQCGLIKFGSRIDMFLPVDARIRVQLGEEVRACETVIAEI